MLKKHLEIILECLADKIDQQDTYIKLLERELDERKTQLEARKDDEDGISATDSGSD